MTTALPRQPRGRGAARPRSPLAGLCRLLGVLGALVLAATGASAGPAGAAAGRGPAAATRGTSGAPSLTLVRQPWTVGPGQSFTATVAVSPATASATAGDGLQVLLYSPLTTRSALSQAVAGDVGGFVTYRSAVTGLDALPPAGPGEYDLSLSLVTPDDTTPATGATAGPAALDCQRDLPGYCGGVYPVVVELVGPDQSAPLATLVTLLVYAYPAGNPYHPTTPLRLATVVPLDLPTAAGGSVAAPAVDQLARLAAATTSPATAGVALTVTPEPDAVLAVEGGTDAADRAAATAVAAAASDPAHQVLSQGFVPVDPTALVDTGLGGELAAQLNRACAVLAGDHPTTGTWVADAPMDDATAAALGQSSCNPVRQLVVPAGTVTGGGCEITCAAPFTVDDGSGEPVTAVEADSQLADEATAAAGDPVLRAHDLVGDLSLTYYEAPTPADPRGVVLALPPAAAVSPGELADTLTGIAADPVLSPVTLQQYFAEVPVGANGQPSTRRLDGSASGPGASTVRGIRSGRAALTAYGGAVDARPTGTASATALGDRLLETESSLLRPAQQGPALRAFDEALRRRLDRISLATGVVRLTSSSVLRVPITLSDNEGFPVSGTLVVSSDKLLFTPTGTCRGTDRSAAGYDGLVCPVDLDKSTNAVYVSMRARTAGDFRVAVSLKAPDGQLTLAHGDISVRSLSASVEAVVLSVVALAVLLTWWARTSWRNRRRGRHAPRRRGRRAEATPAPAAGGSSPDLPARPSGHR